MGSTRETLTQIKVEPTYISTDLITPGKRRRSTLPCIGVRSRTEGGRYPWGNEALHCPHRKITYSHFNPSQIRNPSVDLTHRHHGTRVVQMEAVRQPYDVTSLRLSNCRVNDQRLPSFNSELIPKSKIPEPLGLRMPNPYFSHKSKFQVFPSSDHRDFESVSCKSTTNTSIKQASNSSSNTKLSKNTLNALADVNRAIYHTTTYMNDFPQCTAAAKSSIKSSAVSNEPKKHVTFEENVEYFNRNDAKKTEEDVDHDDGTCQKEVSFDLSKEPFSDPSRMPSDLSNDVSFELCNDELDGKNICRFCGRRIKRRVQLRFMDGNGTINNQSQQKQISTNGSSLETHHSSWPLGITNINENSPNRPKIVIHGYNTRPKGPKRYFDVCQCEQNPQLKESTLRSEAILKRRAANYERRNFTTISVFHKLNPKGSKLDINNDDTSRKAPKRMPRLHDWPLYHKADAHGRFHKRFPETEPDLRDSKRTVRRVVFGGYHSYVFR